MDCSRRTDRGLLPSLAMFRPTSSCPGGRPAHALVYAEKGADLAGACLTRAVPEDATLTLVLPADRAVWPIRRKCRNRGPWRLPFSVRHELVRTLVGDMKHCSNVSHGQPGCFHCKCRVTSSCGTQLGGRLRFRAESICLFQFEGDGWIEDRSNGHRDHLLRQVGDKGNGFPLVILSLIETGDLGDCTWMLVTLNHPPATILARRGRELLHHRRHHPFPSAGCSCLYSASAVPSEISLWRPIVVRTSPTVRPVWFVSSVVANSTPADLAAFAIFLSITVRFIRIV